MTEFTPGHSIETQPQRQLIDADVVVSILADNEREAETAARRTTDVEYMEWVMDIVHRGFDIDHYVIKDAEDLGRIAAGIDDYFDQPLEGQTLALSAHLSLIADTMKRRYNAKVEATLVELNQFIAQHEGLFMDRDTNKPLTELVAVQHLSGRYELTGDIRRASLAIDVTRLSVEQQQAVEKVLQDPELLSVYS